MRHYLSIFVTVAILGLASQASAGMIAADVSGPINPFTGTGSLNIGTAVITGISGLDGSYPTNANLNILSLNLVSGTGDLSITSDNNAFATFFGTLSNVAFGPPTEFFSLTHITADVAFNFPAGLPTSGTLDVNFFVNSTVAGQLVLNTSAVPEPASLAMATMGLAGSLVVFRRKRVRPSVT